MEALSLSLMLACLSLVVVRALTRSARTTQRRQRSRVPYVAHTTQRLGVYGFAQRDVIYDFYQREADALAVRQPTHRSSVPSSSAHGRRLRLSLHQMPWRETFKCDGLQPILGKTLPGLGLAAYLDHGHWNPTWTSAVGWSMVEITSSDSTAPSVFHVGQYGLAIAANASASHSTMGTGLQWTYERNFSCLFRTAGECIQMTFEYDFSKH